MTTSCHICRSSIFADDEVLNHMEQFHTGRRHFEWVHLSCGDCNLRTPLSDENLRFMMRHFSASGHNPRSLAIDWTQFVKNENQRLSQLIKIGSEYETSKAAEKDTDRTELTWSPRPSLSFHGSDSGSIGPVNTALKQALQIFPDIPHLDILRQAAKLQGPIAKPPPPPPPVPLSTTPKVEPPAKRRSITPVNEVAPGNMIKMEQIDVMEAEPRSSLENPFASMAEYPPQPPPIDLTAFYSPSDSPKNRPKPRRDEIDKPLYKCTLCDFTSFQNEKARMLNHALSHDKSLHPFKCSRCDFTAAQLGNVKSHGKRKAPAEQGCDGSYVNIQTEEMIAKTRELLKSTYPHIDWDTQCPPGETLIGIRL